VRRATTADEAGIVRLLRTTMGWPAGGPDADLLAWKHQGNAFGPSPTWIAAVGAEVVALRTFMRWEFEHGGAVIPAVRAVDTATHPDHQGQGLFTRLTRQAVEELTAEGVALVFNTPNERSRPGYLKMGWRQAGRLGVLARPRRPWSLWPMARSRCPAGRWSLPTGAGVPAAEVLADREAVAALLATAPPGSVLRTRRRPEVLAWRYGFAPLHYRALLAGSAAGEGFVLFRLRRRGRAVEAVVADTVVPGDDPGLAGELARRVAGLAGSDYAIRLAGPGARGFFPLPGQGPTLLWRPLAGTDVPPPATWALSLGDVELF